MRESNKTFPKFTLILPDGDSRKARVVFKERTEAGWDLFIAIDEPVKITIEPSSGRFHK